MNVGMGEEALTESQVFKPFVSENKGWGRIMSYYKPWYANIAIMICSFFNTFQWIAVGSFATGLMVIFLAFEASQTGIETSLTCQIPGIGSLLGSEEQAMTKDEFITKTSTILIAWSVWMLCAWFFTGS